MFKHLGLKESCIWTKSYDRLTFSILPQVDLSHCISPATGKCSDYWDILKFYFWCYPTLHIIFKYLSWSLCNKSKRKFHPKDDLVLAQSAPIFLFVYGHRYLGVTKQEKDDKRNKKLYCINYFYYKEIEFIFRKTRIACGSGLETSM